MEEFNSLVEMDAVESEEMQEDQTGKTEHKKEKSKYGKNKMKGDWKGNPIIKGLLLFFFLLFTCLASVMTSVIVFFIENGVYTIGFDGDYQIAMARERVLKENADVIEEALIEYLDMYNMGLTTINVERYGDDIIAYVEEKLATNVGDPFYQFSIRFSPDTDLEKEIYGNLYDPYQESGFTVVLAVNEYYPYAWTEEYTDQYTFDSYTAAMNYKRTLEEQDGWDATIINENFDIIIPELAQYFDGYYPAVTGGYHVKHTYEKVCRTEFCIAGQLTNEYEYSYYYGRGHNLNQEIKNILWMYEVKTNAMVVTVFLYLALVACFILLMMSAGHVHNSTEIHESRLEKIPLEVILIMIGVIIWGVGSIYREVQAAAYNYTSSSKFDILNIYFIGYVICLLLLGFFCCRTLVLRKRTDHILQSSIICRFFIKYLGMESSFVKFQRYVVSKIPFMWKAILIYLLLTLVEIFALTFSSKGHMGIYFLIKIMITALVVVIASWLQELKKGGEELVAGNTKHKVNTRFMKWAFKKHGENLNNLNEGLQVAVEERMKSERMKTELITNVSHDIKTPLTSIINYVDLLQKQNITSEPEASYIDVLARQSARLKKLIDDLVEASKASSGSVTVEMKVMDANLVLAQATAEYVDKLAEKNLRLVMPDNSEPALIRADGRHLWRVIDNLLNNAYKYAMPGTRVYTDVQIVDDRVQITFKNISKDQLNVTSDELMERFVRGDSSRNTEGSGLGLSIAKSLCQLMEADFDIEIDGDLYKAIITFDQVSEEESEIKSELVEKDHSFTG